MAALDRRPPSLVCGAHFAQCVLTNDHRRRYQLALLTNDYRRRYRLALRTYVSVVGGSSNPRCDRRNGPVNGGLVTLSPKISAKGHADA
jgi:hypothetical protein